MPKKRSAVAFQSIRTIGRKAQLILDRARQARHIDDTDPLPSKKSAAADNDVVMHISTGSVVRATFSILAVLAGVWILFHLRDKLLLLILSVFVATLMDPGVQALERWRIPRGLAILTHYLVAFCLILFLILSLIPIIAQQLQQISNSISTTIIPMLEDPQVTLPFMPPESIFNQQFNRFLQTIGENLSIDRFTTNLQETGRSLSDIATESVRFAASIAGSVLEFIVNLAVVLVLAFFIQLEKERILRWVGGFLPERYRPYARQKGEAIHVKIGQWMRGELMLMFSIFLGTFIALNLLGMGDVALTLALLAGFCELVPAVGPFIAAVPAIFIVGVQYGLVYVPILAGLYYVIQWCENNLLVPLIMKRAVGLSPISVLFAMLVGISFPDTIHPILGVMLAVPATTIIAIFLEDWRENRR